ncbi:hypothetical protein ACFQ9D_16765 [Arthrobacter koreensis]|uniref:hypothetical protein n=1 Tax=Arthrobacter koreensis TaxID=199136 RepID=UPI00362EC470
MNDSSENGAEHRSQQPSPRKTTLPTNYVATTADDLFERTRTVAVRLTDEEWERWKTAAKEDGRQQLGRWVRELVARRLDERPGLDYIENIDDLRLNLTRAGSNLNQIARALNIAALGVEAPPELSAIAAAIADTRAAVSDVRDALHEAGR